MRGCINYEADEAVEADWSILDLPYVRDIARQAARRVAKKYENVVDREDLEQEALILLATKADLQATAQDEENIGLLQHGLEADLEHHCLMATREPEREEWNPKEGKFAESKRQDHSAILHHSREISYDKLKEDAEAAEEGGFVVPYVVIETASNDYTRESVETLLPAVWDESYVYGLPQREDAPDPDMPKGSSNKARGNNLSAYIADIRTGWEKTPLTVKERRALILAYGIGWTQKEIAFNQDVSQQMISRRIEGAIGKIVARMNGGYWAELEGIEA